MNLSSEMRQPKPKLQTLCLKSLKRTYDLYRSNVGAPITPDESSQKAKLAYKILSEYMHVQDMPNTIQEARKKVATGTDQPQAVLRVEAGEEGQHKRTEPEPTPTPSPPVGATTNATKVKGSHPAPGVALSSQAMDIQQEEEEDTASSSSFQNLISSLELKKDAAGGGVPPPGVMGRSIVEYRQNNSLVQSGGPNSSAITKYTKRKKPTWHAPWKLKHVVSGHGGWVRCVAVEPGNEWFCTGAADRTIKLWDLATGTLKVSLTGHIAAVRGVIVSHRHNYIFSCGEDRMIKCWDLEQNKVIRHYHGHLSGIYSIAMHPQLDVLMTGGRDSTCRVWDIRTKAEIHVLSGHTNLVSTVCAQGADPQVVTGSADTTIKLWDLGMGKAITTLTNHKKSIRAMLIHPTEFCFVSAAADNVKKWKFPKGEFICNMSGHNAIINTVTLNQENVLVTAADNGSIVLWDWATGYPFQKLQTQVQPGSLDSEAGIFAASFDLSGSRLITCEADKTIKVWWEDVDATSESHPVDPMWRPNRDRNRF